MAIAAASIVAKVTRDRLMVALDAEFPKYGLAQHKGYPVPSHMLAVHTHGPSRVHRVTFAPTKHRADVQERLAAIYAKRFARKKEKDEAEEGGERGGGRGRTAEWWEQAQADVAAWAAEDL